MHAVDPLHSAFGLGRTRTHDPDVQPLTHTPKLRERNFSPQLFGGCGLSLVHVFPSRYIASAVRHISRSRPAAHLQPPRWSLLSPFEPGHGWWHHPPCPSGSHGDHDFLANHGNYRPVAPVPRSAICAPFAGSVSCASAAGSTALLATSKAVRFRDPRRCRLLRQKARPPPSARISRPPNRNFFFQSMQNSTAQFLWLAAIRGPSCIAMLQ